MHFTERLDYNMVFDIPTFNIRIQNELYVLYFIQDVKYNPNDKNQIFSICHFDNDNERKTYFNNNYWMVDFLNWYPIYCFVGFVCFLISFSYIRISEIVYFIYIEFVYIVRFTFILIGILGIKNDLIFWGFFRNFSIN